MKTKPSIQQKILDMPGDPTRWLRGLEIAIRVCLILGLMLILAAPVQAAPPGPNNSQSSNTDFIGIFKALASLFIQIAFSLMFILFAVGSVKNGLGAQWAHQFGIAHRLSEELLNLVVGVVIFAIGLLTLTLVNLVMTQVQGHFGNQLTIPTPSINIQ